MMIDARPAALVNGRSILWGDLRPMLAEAAGAEVLEEHILNRAVENLAQESGVTVSPDEIAAEQYLLVHALHSDPSKSLRLLDDYRTSQNLGPVRFQALLKRNATLRALVRDQVQISEESIRRMFDMIHGTQRQARLILAPDLSTAQHALALINAGALFTDVAVELSIDPSARRGGLLEPFSRYDPSYPEGLRSALWSLNLDEVSAPIMLEQGFAVLQLHKIIEADTVDPAQVRDELAEIVRLDQERLLMDRLAMRLLSDVSVTIFDDSLHHAWQQRRRP